RKHLRHFFSKMFDKLRDLFYIDGTNRPRQARPPPRQAALPRRHPARLPSIAPPSTPRAAPSAPAVADIRSGYSTSTILAARTVRSVCVATSCLRYGYGSETTAR